MKKFGRGSRVYACSAMDLGHDNLFYFDIFQFVCVILTISVGQIRFLIAKAYHLEHVGVLLKDQMASQLSSQDQMAA